MIDKACGKLPFDEDYELHCAAVTDARQRSPLAEAVQRELDRRYMLPLREAAKAKTTEALAAWWDEALRSQHIAGPLWAALTHARCTPALERRVLGNVHMLQHTAGMAARVDLNRFEALIDENAVLARALGTAQQRNTRQATDHARRCESQQCEIVQLRAQLIARDTTLGHLQEDLHALEAAVPGLQSRADLGRENQRLTGRLHELERRVLHLQQELERQQRRGDELAAQLTEQRQRDIPVDATELSLSSARLDAQAVLCVGGRTAAVPMYRQLIEQVGGRFLHHDGGEEDSTARLDVTLEMADLVICQTGCISHDAYWRVKDHCKRTGKRCVFIETPSTTGLKRALLMLKPVPTTS